MANKTLAFLFSVVLLLAGGLVYYLEYSKPTPVEGAPLTAEGKAYVRNLRLSDVTIKATESYMKQTIIEVEGKISNAGDRPLSVVEIYCIFYDDIGQLVLRKRVPIVSRKMGGLEPSEAKSFRLAFDELPPSWNQALPQLVIASVMFP